MLELEVFSNGCSVFVRPLYDSRTAIFWAFKDDLPLKALERVNLLSKDIFY